MAPEEISSQFVESLNGKFLSSILHLFPLFYPIFTYVDPDPYSEYGTNLDPGPQR